MVVSSIVRRGVEFAFEHLPKEPSKQPPKSQLSGWFVALFIATLVAFVLISWSIEYTYGMVVTTLTAVEDSNPDVYVRIDTDINPDKSVDPAEPEVEAVRPMPITSKLRTTVKHLRARAGPWSRFRGLSMFLTYTAISSFLLGLMPFSSTNFIGQGIYLTLVGTLLSNFQLAWVHIVISEPSAKRFYQRIPGYKSWLKIAPVAAFEQAACALAFYLPLIIIKACGGLDELASAPENNVPPSKAMWHACAVIAAPALFAFTVSIPARVIFIRVAASMLPEEDETIVPMDRSFGGKVTPAILGGSGKLSITDAWKTFDRASRVRFLKVVFKVFAIEFSVGLFFSLILTGELLIGADTFMKIFADMVSRNGA
ncbi:uncharacterized protein ACLA_087220 [Aspergillus clavatus NRRL 1]|uniref:Ubiquitin conjugating enzyme n=1 Tax=Aspergillus clavatus (strain ATCC 1007 / CBS 513.65 / DSM 816 / NCTC 3887 / NRRL 1 / QM 1276 / 107) TaxID=344612 RepID=A1CUN1_ASPCL|nr:uncharacterized protein ACLA_087220 [Aspergillus clavatus NRRL 1]EAW07018.1 conserved hypothetical protein [Aspergillus clavatus NRRL 1]